MPNSESRGFKITILIVTGLLAVLLIVDLVYFYMIRSGSSPSKGSIDGVMIANAIFLFIFLIIFVWSLLRLFIHKDTRTKYVNKSKQKVKNYFTSEEGGFTDSDIASAKNKITSGSKYSEPTVANPKSLGG